MDVLIHYVGVSSSICIFLMFIPQILHVRRTKNTLALNYIFLSFNFIAATLGLVYAFYFKILPMIIANLGAFCSTFYLIIFKYSNEKVTGEGDFQTTGL